MHLYDIERLMFLYDIEVADWWGWVILLVLVVPIVLGVFIYVGSFAIAFIVLAYGNPRSTPRKEPMGPETDPFEEGTDLHNEYFDR